MKINKIFLLLSDTQFALQKGRTKYAQKEGGVHPQNYF